MRIITLNVNGIRSAERKGFARWLARAEPGRRLPAGDQGAGTTTCRARCARRAAARGISTARRSKGYSGVGDLRASASRRDRRPASAAASSTPRAAISRRTSRELDASISVYLPSGSSGPHRQAAKFRFLDAFLPHLAKLRRRRREIVLCGDWNIAHQEIDLKNWRSNQKNSGFLPEERAWLTRVFDELGFVDVFRRLDPRPEQYTWWSNRGQAWAKNVGWRIDYQIATPGIAAKATRGGDLHEPALLRSRAAGHRLRLRAAQ